MLVPPWVPRLNGVPASTWIDLALQQYWNNGAVVTNLAGLLVDHNGTPFTFNANGIDIPTPPPFGVLPQAQGPLMQTLNTLDAAGGYTVFVGFIYAGGNGNGDVLDMGNPGVIGPNFNLFELGTNDSAAPNYGGTWGLELLTAGQFAGANGGGAYGQAVLQRQALTYLVSDPSSGHAPTLTTQIGGEAPVKTVMAQQMGPIEFFYAGGSPNVHYSPPPMHNSFPTGTLRYIAIFGPLPLAPWAGPPLPPGPPGPPFNPGPTNGGNIGGGGGGVNGNGSPLPTPLPCIPCCTTAAPIIDRTQP